MFRKTETVSQIFPTVSQNPQSGKSGVNSGYITITKIHWNLVLRPSRYFVEMLWRVL